METKRFAKNDCSFICADCGTYVPPLGYSSRNHCPICLCSRHVDVNPGDRESDCGGIMRAVRAEVSPRKGYVIVHKCERCGYVGRNRAAEDDDLDMIIKLTAGEAYI